VTSRQVNLLTTNHYFLHSLLKLSALGMILILDILRKRNLIVGDWCCMCKKSLLHFDFARTLLNFVCCLCGLEWVMPQWVVDLFASWRGQCGCFSECSSLEDDSAMVNMMYLERKKH
jgi:hypothetical protein